MATFIYGLKLTLTELVTLAESEGIESPGWYQIDLNQLSYPQGFDLVYRLQQNGFVKHLEVEIINCRNIYLGVSVTKEAFPSLIDDWPVFLEQIRLELRVALENNLSKEQLMRIVGNDTSLKYYSIPYCGRCGT